MARLRFQMTEADYREADDAYEGRCIECGAVANSIEPDARGYECEECRAKAVYGVQELVLMGLLDIKGGERSRRRS